MRKADELGRKLFTIHMRLDRTRAIDPPSLRAAIRIALAYTEARAGGDEPAPAPDVASAFDEDSRARASIVAVSVEKLQTNN